MMDDVQNVTCDVCVSNLLWANLTRLEPVFASVCLHFHMQRRRPPLEGAEMYVIEMPSQVLVCGVLL